MKSIYILVRILECYDCEGETELLFASEDKSILETYNKAYNKDNINNGSKYDILEVKVLPSNFEEMLKLFSIL